MFVTVLCVFDARLMRAFKFRFLFSGSSVTIFPVAGEFIRSTFIVLFFFEFRLMFFVVGADLFGCIF